jgi:hypothetical protein
MTEQPHPYQLLINANQALVENCHRFERLCTEQQKLIDNLTAENDRLKPKPKQLKTITQTRFGRNASWKRSAWLGLREGVLLAPSRLIEAIKTPGLAFVITGACVVGSVLLWVVARPVILISGLCGFVIEKKEQIRQ